MSPLKLKSLYILNRSNFMAKETEALLRSILFQAMRANTKEEIIFAIKAMCSDDDISSVVAAISELERQAIKEE